MASSKVLSVIITGDVKGAMTAFGKLDAASGATSSNVGAQFAKVGLLIGAAFAAAAVGAGIALFKIGESFDEAYDKIRVGTGATGADLERLKDDFKQVVQDVPTDFGKASDAITLLNQKLGLTGTVLQDRAEQFLEVSRITGTDLSANLQAGTDAINGFNIGAEYQGIALDQIFRASQKSGLSFTDLAGQMADSGLVLRGLGFDFAQSAAIIGTLGKAGLSAADAIPSLTKALGEAAKDGIPAEQFFAGFIDRIKSAASDDEARGIAFDVLGQRAGPKFAQLIREGKLSYDELLASITGGGDTIMGAGAETQDFAEKWQMFKNKVLVALEPVATKVFNALGVAMDRLPGIIATIREKAQPAVDWLRDAWPEVQHAVEVVVAFFDAEVWPRLVEGFNYAKGQVANLVAFFEQRWDKIRQAVQNVVEYLKIVWGPALILIRNVWDHIGEIIDAAWQYIRGVVKAGVDAIRGIIDIVLGLLTLDFDQAWTGIQTLVGAALDAIRNTINLALDSIRIGISIALATIGDLWSIAWNGIKAAAGAAWDGIKAAISAGIDGIVGFIESLPGRIAGFYLAMAGAGLQLGGALLGGLKAAFTDAVGIAGDIAEGILGVMKGAWNAFANTANDLVPDKINMPWPAPDIDLPDNPIPTFHTGGIYRSGMTAREGLARLADGEGIFTSEQMAHLAPVGAGGGRTYQIVVNVPPSADRAEIGRELVRCIDAYEKRGGA